MKICAIQDLCPLFSDGSNKPPNHHVRMTVPCIKYIDMSCEMGVRIQEFLGGPIACNLEKIRRAKKEVNNEILETGQLGRT